MKISIDLSQDEAKQLKDFSDHLGVTSEDLVRAALKNLIGYHQEGFQKAVSSVLRKNKELYRKLR
jgi:pantothenate kinase